MTLPPFPEVDSPLVSVVVVTYGGWNWARRALSSLRQNTDPCYEVIVVDNASPDQTAERLRAEVQGARIEFNDRNLGFGPAVNQGASAASGRYLCILNSDALVLPGWLPPLLQAVEEDQKVGAAVPMLLNLDGTLQEAGALVDGDGVTIPYGLGADPNAFEYCFRRYVDYGSAACLLVDVPAFRSVGGFDPRYRMYYEDVDLCFGLAEQGLRTVYEPRSKVFHARWGSGDRVGAERWVRTSRMAFADKWSARLAHRPPLSLLPLYPHRRLAARDVEADPRILVVADRIASGQPDSPDRAWRTFIEELATMWPLSRITVLTLSHPGDSVTGLLDQGIEVIPIPPDLGIWFEGRRRHYTAVVVRGAKTFQRVKGLVQGTQPDAGRCFGPDDGEEGQAEGLCWATVALCDRDAQEALVRSLADGLVVARIAGEPADGSGRRRLLVDALAHLGIPPPPQ
jgi:GT2 family glycosyltransferase